MNWLIFGSSGFEKKPEGGVLKNFVMCAKKDFAANYYVKTICDPMKVFVWYDPHIPMYYRGFYSLNENGEIIKQSVVKEIRCKKIRVNHYFTKSKEEYLQKKSRGYADSTKERPMDDFYANDKNDVKDTEIISHI